MLSTIEKKKREKKRREEKRKEVIAMFSK